MANTVTKEYLVKVISEGLKEVINDFGELNEAGDRVTEGSGQQTKALRELDRNLKGTAEMTSNSTKAFAKMQQGMEGIVPVYAVIASNIFALSAAFLALRNAADFTIMTQAAEQFGARTGKSIMGLAKDIRALTGDTITLQNALQRAVTAQSSGLNVEQIRNLTRLASAASSATGSTIEDTINRVFGAITKLTPDLLETIGITVRLGDVTRDYAKELGKVPAALTAAEKQMGLYNAMYQKLEESFGAATDVDVNPLSKLASSFSDISHSVKELLNNALGPFVRFFSDNITALAVLVTAFGVTVATKAIPSLQNFGTRLDNLSDKSAANAAKSFLALGMRQEEYRNKTVTTMGAIEAKFKETSTKATNYLKAMEAELVRTGNTSHKSFSKIQNALLMPEGSVNQAQKINQMINGYITSIQQGKRPLLMQNKAFLDMALTLKRELQPATAAYTASLKGKMAQTQTATQVLRQYIAMQQAATKANLAAAQAQVMGAVSAGWNKGLVELIANIRETSTRMNALYGIQNKLAIGAVATTKAIAGLGAWIAKMGQRFAMWYIAVQATLAIFRPLMDRIGLTSKYAAELGDATDKLGEELDDVNRKIDFFNSTLKSLPNTIDNNNKRLEHQINTLDALGSAVTNVNNALSKGGFGLWDKFLGSVSFGSMGSLSAVRKQLDRAAQELIKSDSSHSINEFMEQYGRSVADIPTDQLDEFASVLSKVRQETQEALQVQLDYNKALQESFKTLGDAVSAYSNDLPKLSTLETSIAAIQSTITAIQDAVSRGKAGMVVDLMSGMDPSTVRTMGIQRDQLEELSRLHQEKSDNASRISKIEQRAAAQSIGFTNAIAAQERNLATERERHAKLYEIYAEAGVLGQEAVQRTLAESETRVKKAEIALKGVATAANTVSEAASGMVDSFGNSKEIRTSIDSITASLARLHKMYNSIVYAQEVYAQNMFATEFRSGVTADKEAGRIEAISNEQAAAIALRSTILQTLQSELDSTNKALETARNSGDIAAMTELSIRRQQLENAKKEATTGAVDSMYSTAIEEANTLITLQEQLASGDRSQESFADLATQSINNLVLAMQTAGVPIETISGLMGDLAAGMRDVNDEILNNRWEDLSDRLKLTNKPLQTLTQDHKLLEMLLQAHPDKIDEIREAWGQAAKVYAKTADPVANLIEQLELEADAKKRGKAEGKAHLAYTEAMKKIYEDFPKLENNIPQDVLDRIKELFEEIHKVSAGSKIESIGNNLNAAFGSLRSMTEEGSKGFRQLTAAMDAANVMAAIGAVLQQANSDPYSAFARMAAMAAAVAQLGYSVGALSGSEPLTPKEIQARQGTGSILGDSDAQSESILKVLEITKTATEAILGVNTRMYQAIKSMNAGIRDAATLVARRTELGGDAPANITFGDRATAAFDSINNMAKQTIGGVLDFVGLDMLTPIADVFVDVLDFIFLGLPRIVSGLFGGKSRVTDEGIRVIGDSLANMLEGVTLQAYMKYQTKSSSFSSWKNREQTAVVDQSVEDQFSLIFQSMANAISSAAGILGMSDSSINRAFETFIIKTTDISLRGLKPEEQSEQINKIFSNIFDDLAAHAIPWMREFQRAGEGMGETLIRIAQNVSFTDTALARLGMSFGRLRPQTLAELSTIMVEVAGGFEALADGMSAFINGFYSEQEQMEVMQGDLTRALAQLNLSLPEARDGFRNLVEGVNVNTAAGAELFAMLMTLSGAAAQYYDALEAAEDATESLSKKILDGFRNLDSMILSRILDPLDYAFVELGYAEEDRLELAKEIGYDMVRLEYLNMLERKALLEEFASDYLNSLESLNDYVNSLPFDNIAPVSYAERLANAQQSYSEALLKAQSGDTEAIQSLPDISRTLLDLSNMFYGGTSEFRDIWDSVTGQLSAIITDQRDPLIIEMEKNSRQSIENTTRIVDGLREIRAEISKLVASNASLQDWITLQQSGVRV